MVSVPSSSLLYRYATGFFSRVLLPSRFGPYGTTLTRRGQAHANDDMAISTSHAGVLSRGGGRSSPKYKNTCLSVQVPQGDRAERARPP